MAPTTVTGRVRATVRLKSGGEPGARVVASSWASDRAFPRTVGTAVPFEIETGDGAVYRIDPFDALVTLPVRARGEEGGVRREEAWIGAHDEITVEGQLERAGRARLPPALRALRISVSGPMSAHRLPPRSLQRGELERIEPPEGPAKETEGDPTLARRPKKRRPDPSGTPPPVD